MATLEGVLPRCGIGLSLIYFFQIVIILRGLPGAGKSHVAKLIKVTFAGNMNIQYIRESSNKVLKIGKDGGREGESHVFM